VGQLVVFTPRWCLGWKRIGPFLAFRVGWRDETDFVVENVEQIIKVLGALAIAGRFQQLGIRPHGTLDVGAGYGQQNPQVGSGSFLVITMFGVRRLRRERLFKERDANALGAAYLLQGSWSPRSAFHHLGKQGQPDANDFVFLGQARDGLFQELLLFLADVTRVLGQFPEGPPKRSQHLLGVVKVE
jgi:hypothetical protein